MRKVLSLLLSLCIIILLMLCCNDSQSDQYYPEASVTDSTATSDLELAAVPCLEAGRLILAKHCNNCHSSMFEDRTGPALAGVEQRRSRASLKAFILNPGKEMFTGADSAYYRCQKATFGSMMTAFPQFTGTQLDCVFDYIRSESAKYPGRRSAWHNGYMSNMKKTNGRFVCW